MNELKAPSLNSLLGSDRGSTDSLLAESLLDMEELDDVEYSIPPTGALPSLETVLSEFEADSDIASELGIPPPTPTPSIADESSVRISGSGGGGSIMRYTMLQGISTQLSSAADRINAGLASSCCVCNHYYAVGTSHGHILNFDISQTLRWAHQDKNGQGAVSSMSYNPECNRLLAGFARGLVIMLDTQSGDVMRQLFDVVTPNTGVLHVKWTSKTAMALAADSGGSVWSLSFTRKLGVRGCSTRCLFSGARGEVCAVEPLLSQTNEHHDLDQYCIVALATLSKYFIVTIRPRLKVIKYHLLQGPPDCLPVLAWQMVLIQAADTSRSVDPVLVVGRGNQLFFHQLFISNGRITLLLLRHITMQTNLLSVHWLGPKCVGCLDTSEILHLLDVRSSKELECIDLANAGMIYGSAQFKGLATGGNVSPALALAGTHACYNSLACRGVQLYILGSRTMHSIGVRTWMERITYLVKNQRWQEACDLALDGYKAAGERPKRKQQAKERILMLFREYIAASARAPDYCLGAIIKCLITVGELELLCTQLWERLQNKELFLHHISTHIQNDDIHYINPIISQALVDYWLNICPSQLEQIILKMDWSCLDLDQVVKACKKFKLYKAYIFLNATALGDFTISLTELIPLLDDYTNTDLGNCLLVYISSCLAGRGYPQGEIPEESKQNVKHDVLRCLTSMHSTANEPNELAYPYLRALLKFNTRETLNVISLAFQEKEFNSDLGFRYRDRLVNILLEIVTPESNSWFTIGCLLNFIAQQISQACLPADNQLLEKVLNYLSQENIENESARLHSERENAWHELLINNCLDSITNNEEQLLLARKARCYYVEEYLLEKLQRYDTILECYLNNPLRHETMFVYINHHYKDEERQIYEQIRKHIKRLLTIDANETTRIVDFYYHSKINELLSLVQDDEKILFIFLKHLQYRKYSLVIEQKEQLLELLCKFEPQEVDTFLQNNEDFYTENTLKVVQKYNLQNAAIFVAEKMSDYKLAFKISMDILASAKSENMAECAKSVSALCARSSTSSNSHLTHKERESLWMDLLTFILPLEELKSLTKSMLHEASQHVDLPNLVQLVMNTHNVSGSFGDIKELLLSMLNQSKQDTQAIEITQKILEKELAKEFHKHHSKATRGLWITMMCCVVCNQRLCNQSAILVIGSCGHAMHEQCSVEFLNKHNENPSSINDDDHDDDDSENDNYIECPYCLQEIDTKLFDRPMQLAKPSHNVINYNAETNEVAHRANRELGVLQLKAPPRKF